jgi:hypothetical protein
VRQTRDHWCATGQILFGKVPTRIHSLRMGPGLGTAEWNCTPSLHPGGSLYLYISVVPVNQASRLLKRDVTLYSSTKSCLQTTSIPSLSLMRLTMGIDNARCFRLESHRTTSRVFVGLRFEKVLGRSDRSWRQNNMMGQTSVPSQWHTI